MRSFFWMMLAVLAVLFAGCDQEVYVYDLYDGWSHDRGPVTIYHKQHPLLDDSLVLEACNMWERVGADCSNEPNSGNAMISIFVDGGPCKLDENGGYYVAQATYLTNEITIVEDCLYQSYGDEALDHLPRVLAHEIGHILGVELHIPLDCDNPWDSLSIKDAELPYNEDGNLICGPAIMNREPYEELPWISEQDAELYDRMVVATGYSLF